MGISMKFLGKMWLITILKVTKSQIFTLSLEDTFLEKPRGEGQVDPTPSRLRAKRNKRKIFRAQLIIYDGVMLRN